MIELVSMIIFRIIYCSEPVTRSILGFKVHADVIFRQSGDDCPVIFCPLKPPTYCMIIMPNIISKDLIRNLDVISKTFFINFLNLCWYFEMTIISTSTAKFEIRLIIKINFKFSRDCMYLTNSTRSSTVFMS